MLKPKLTYCCRILRSNLFNVLCFILIPIFFFIVVSIGNKVKKQNEEIERLYNDTHELLKIVETMKEDKKLNYVYSSPSLESIK